MKTNKKVELGPPDIKAFMKARVRELCDIAVGPNRPKEQYWEHGMWQKARMSCSVYSAKIIFYP